MSFSGEIIVKWLTQKQVKEAAKKSRKAAIECSRLHWEQLATATDEESGNKRDSLMMSVLDGHEYCALCKRFFAECRCNDCPLVAADGGCHTFSTQYQACARSRIRGHAAFQIEAKKMEQILGELS